MLNSKLSKDEHLEYLTPFNKAVNAMEEAATEFLRIKNELNHAFRYKETEMPEAYVNALQDISSILSKASDNAAKKYLKACKRLDELREEIK